MKRPYFVVKRISPQMWLEMCGGTIRGRHVSKITTVIKRRVRRVNQATLLGI
jgi:hypothetical protein